jgi:uncharacterized protein Yka (UPF0111/DUF47 family)
MHNKTEELRKDIQNKIDEYQKELDKLKEDADNNTSDKRNKLENPLKT